MQKNRGDNFSAECVLFMMCGKHPFSFWGIIKGLASGNK